MGWQPLKKCDVNIPLISLPLNCRCAFAVLQNIQTPASSNLSPIQVIYLRQLSWLAQPSQTLKNQNLEKNSKKIQKFKRANDSLLVHFYS